MAAVGFVDLNGTDGLTWANSPAIPDSGEITVEMWFKGFSDDCLIKTSSGSGGGTGWYFNCNYGFVCDDTAYHASGAGYGSTIWQYVAFTRATNGNLQGYYAQSGDSSLTTGTFHSVSDSLTSNSGTLKIIRNTADWSVALVRVWNRKLSTAELGAIWNKLITGDGTGDGLSGLAVNWSEELDSPGSGTSSGDFQDKAGSRTNTVTSTPTRNTGGPDLTTYSGGGGTTTNKTLSATVTSTPSVRKSVGKPFSRTVTSTPTMVRSVGKVMARTVTSTPSLIKSVGKSFARTVTSTPTLLKSVGKPFAVTVTSTASLVRSVGKPLSVVSTATVTTTRSIAKGLTVTSTAAVSLLKSVTKTFSVTSTATATLAASKAYLRTLSVTVTSTPSMVRSVGKVLAVTVTSAPTVARSISKTFAVTVTATASLTKSIGKTLSAVVSTVVSLAHVFQAGSNVEAPGYAFLSDEPTARASVFDSRMGIATLTEAIVGRSEVTDGGS